MVILAHRVVRAAKYNFIVLVSLYLLVLHTAVEIMSAYNPEPSWIYRITRGKVGRDLGMRL